jgi:rhamnulokinase
LKAANVIAFDVGAGSGRVSVGSFNGEQIVIREIHRFSNRPVKLLDSLHWDILSIFHELKCALARLSKNETYLSAGIDAWGADYGLIDRRGRLLGNVYHYRDSRTDHIEERLLEKIPARALFAMTASDLKRHYTLAQVYSQVVSGDPLLTSADKLLLIPDLLNYLFTGAVTAEKTIAGTSQLLSSSLDSWNQTLLALLEIPEKLFPPITSPGTTLGPIQHAYEIETGFSKLNFVSVSGHDTASALTSVVDMDDASAFVSAGTTIVVGTETNTLLTSDLCFKYGFKNCPGTGGKNLLMRNNTGFWILQQCQRQWERQSSFSSLSQKARHTKRPASIFDPESADFQNPESMLESIKRFAVRTNQTPPQTRGDYTRSIYASLALQVRWCVERLGEILGTRLDRIHLIGGGANDTLFCEVVADCTCLPVRAGPAEATTIGNVMVQLLGATEILSLSDIREVVKRSFPTRDYLPNRCSDEQWKTLYLNFNSYKEAAHEHVRGPETNDRRDCKDHGSKKSC